MGNRADHGGIDVKVCWFGDKTNLHSVWDTQKIAGQDLSYTEYASRLDRQIEPTQIVAWLQPDPLVWIAKSTAIRDRIYPEMNGAMPSLGYSY